MTTTTGSARSTAARGTTRSTSAPGTFGQQGSTADGGPGNDAITTTSYSQVDGGPGNDLIVGQPPGANALLAGGDGDDRIFSLYAPHAVDGGAGHDILSSGSTVRDTGGCGPDDDLAIYGSSETSLADCETVLPIGYWPDASVTIAAAGQSVPGALSPPDEHSAVTTQVTTPHVGGVTIDRVGAPAASDEIPLTVRVGAPPTTAAEPLTIGMRVDDTVAAADATVILRRDGVDVPDCDSPVTLDPCVSERSRSDGDLVLTVSASRGGAFTFAIPGAPAPPAYPDYPNFPNGKPPTPAPTPTPQPSTTTAHAVLGAVKIPTLEKVISKGVRVPLTCAAKCRTTVQLRLARRTARKLHLGVVVGSKTVSFSGKRTVVVKPTRKAAKKLRKLRSAKLAIKTMS